jgi:hypothetical protein
MDVVGCGLIVGGFGVGVFGTDEVDEVVDDVEDEVVGGGGVAAGSRLLFRRGSSSPVSKSASKLGGTSPSWSRASSERNQCGQSSGGIPVLSTKSP